ncbi:MAG: hypothetical protein WC494_02140 [Candidatus Pacearchaeota archaeon]
MKKGFLIFILLFARMVVASSGVSPGSYEVNFEPFLEKTFSFAFIFEEGVVSTISVEGPLSDYVFLDKRTIIGSEVVTARLKLPEKIDFYGVNKIRISAKQVPEESGGVELISNVGGIIRVFVPYPGKRPVVFLNVYEGNERENVRMNLKIINEGNESFLAKPSIHLFNGEEKVYEKSFNESVINSLNSYEIDDYLNTSALSSGEYGAVALVDYGVGFFERGEDFFRIGKLFINITNYTMELNRSEVEKFNIELESLYNNEIREAYAEVFIEGKSFYSPIFYMKPWEKKNISVFLDTYHIKERNSSALITLHYNNITNSETIFVNVLQSNLKLYLFVLFLIILLVSVAFILWKINKIG